MRSRRRSPSSPRASAPRPLRDGSTCGAFHRGWLELKAALEQGSPRSILTECRRGEDAALETYRAALHANLPPGVREVVQEQYEAVKKAREEISTLAETLEA
ncbi:MAG TPA: PA2169 family four-helix-bundle protein [Polyangiaceae bacterium]|nr:PA2169 family four-helix-bundle protein [Polyangiaceae bacterium]